MKKYIIICLALCMMLMLSCCTAKTNTQSGAVQKTPLPQSNTPTQNPISGPITNSNRESALSDARNCLNVLVMSLAEEGIGTIDEGIIFVVEKAGSEYTFVYADGDLTDAGNTEKGVEITPSSPDWLSNVRAYMP